MAPSSSTSGLKSSFIDRHLHRTSVMIPAPLTTTSRAVKSSSRPGTGVPPPKDGTGSSNWITREHEAKSDPVDARDLYRRLEIVRLQMDLEESRFRDRYQPQNTIRRVNPSVKAQQNPRSMPSQNTHTHSDMARIEDARARYQHVQPMVLHTDSSTAASSISLDSPGDHQGQAVCVNLSSSSNRISGMPVSHHAFTDFHTFAESSNAAGNAPRPESATLSPSLTKLPPPLQTNRRIQKSASTNFRSTNERSKSMSRATARYVLVPSISLDQVPIITLPPRPATSGGLQHKESYRTLPGSSSTSPHKNRTSTLAGPLSLNPLQHDDLGLGVRDNCGPDLPLDDVPALNLDFNHRTDPAAGPVTTAPFTALPDIHAFRNQPMPMVPTARRLAMLAKDPGMFKSMNGVNRQTTVSVQPLTSSITVGGVGVESDCESNLFHSDNNATERNHLGNAFTRPPPPVQGSVGSSATQVWAAMPADGADPIEIPVDRISTIDHMDNKRPSQAKSLAKRSLKFLRLPGLKSKSSMPMLPTLSQSEYQSADSSLPKGPSTSHGPPRTAAPTVRKRWSLPGSMRAAYNPSASLTTLPGDSGVSLNKTSVTHGHRRTSSMRWTKDEANDIITEMQQSGDVDLAIPMSGPPPIRPCVSTLHLIEEGSRGASLDAERSEVAVESCAPSIPVVEVFDQDLPTPVTMVLPETKTVKRKESFFTSRILGLRKSFIRPKPSKQDLTCQPPPLSAKPPISTEHEINRAWDDLKAAEEVRLNLDSSFDPTRPTLSGYVQPTIQLSLVPEPTVPLPTEGAGPSLRHRVSHTLLSAHSKSFGKFRRQRSTPVLKASPPESSGYLCGGASLSAVHLVLPGSHSRGHSRSGIDTTKPLPQLPDDNFGPVRVTPECSILLRQQLTRLREEEEQQRKAGIHVPGLHHDLQTLERLIGRSVSVEASDLVTATRSPSRAESRQASRSGFASLAQSRVVSVGPHSSGSSVAGGSIRTIGSPACASMIAQLPDHPATYLCSTRAASGCSNRTTESSRSHSTVVSGLSFTSAVSPAISSTAPPVGVKRIGSARRRATRPHKKASPSISISVPRVRSRVSNSQSRASIEEKLSAFHRTCLDESGQGANRVRPTSLIERPLTQLDASVDRARKHKSVSWDVSPLIFNHSIDRFRIRSDLIGLKGPIFTTQDVTLASASDAHSAPTQSDPASLISIAKPEATVATLIQNDDFISQSRTQSVRRKRISVVPAGKLPPRNKKPLNRLAIWGRKSFGFLRANGSRGSTAKV